MNFICPVCNYDLEPQYNSGLFSIYMSDYLECPECKSVLQGDYDESWDGHEEIQYYTLKIIEEKNEHNSD